MQITEIPGDLFSAKSIAYMQCISADIACGKGIAVAFNQHFNTKNKLKTKYGNQMLAHWDTGNLGFAVLEPPVINLITKRRYFDKPTEQSLRNALHDAVRLCKEYDIHEIAMPYIASGLDRMNWQTQVKPIIASEFQETDIIITVYSGKH